MAAIGHSRAREKGRAARLITSGSVRLPCGVRAANAALLPASMFIFEGERWQPKMAVHLPFIQREKPVPLLPGWHGS